MILFYSGNESVTKTTPCTPEIALFEYDPAVMLSYFFMHMDDEKKESKHHIYKRFKRHCLRRQKKR